MNKKQLTLILSSIAIIIIIAAASIIIFYGLLESEEPEIVSEVIEYDDRISPNINQGLTVEIHRIRHRSILDQIFRISYRWKDPPVSYWIVTVDGKECNSEGNIGFGSSGVFTEWDSMLKECRVNYYVEDEQETSEVNIKIVEKKSVGLLGLRSNDVVEEEIHMTYHYRTGRWEGDDYFKDNDGYGHYLGDNVEIWFNIYQSDYDHDGIPYWTEKNILLTDPMVDDSKLDPDNDGIPTSWEWKWDYDPFTWDDHEKLDPDIDGIENIEEYMMQKFFANPYQPDMYIETDGMEKKNFLDLPHVFHKDSQHMLIERFAQHGINLYIDDGWPDSPTNGGGELLPFIKEIDEVVGGQIASFYQHHFPDERKGIFRYVVIAINKGWNTPSTYNNYDTMLVYSGRRPSIRNFFAVTPRLRSILLAKGVLHELGHSMGLMPYSFPGNDIMPPVGARYPNMPEEEYKQYLNQYHSIMNYNFIYRDRDLIDYSDGANGEPYDQDDWKYIYLPSFQSDARAFEEPVDETFEDFELMEDEIYPEINGWTTHINYTQELNINLNSLAFSDLKIRNDFLLLTSNDEELDRNIKVYVRPDIDPFPVIQSWTLIAEGKLDHEQNNLHIYSIDEKIEDVLTSIS
jgi:hypothetical protein